MANFLNHIHVHERWMRCVRLRASARVPSRVRSAGRFDFYSIIICSARRLRNRTIEYAHLDATMHIDILHSISHVVKVMPSLTSPFRKSRYSNAFIPCATCPTPTALPHKNTLLLLVYESHDRLCAYHGPLIFHAFRLRRLTAA